MRIAYLDCFSGMSGDMFMGALVDAGVPAQLLEQTVANLGIGARLQIASVNRSGITAIKVDVRVEGEADGQGESGGHSHDHDHSHSHDLSDASPSSDHAHEPKRVQLREHNYVLAESPARKEPPVPDHPNAHSHGRGLTEIRGIIEKAGISAVAKRTATSIFEALGAAEAKIHDTPIERVHFHEVGAVDALVDIVCAAVGAEALGVDEIVCSPLNVGGGTVKCAHGVFPVPAPATLELLKDIPVFSSGLQAELVTPTGAAIVKTLAARFMPFPALRVERIGYGAGTKDFPGHANVVRLTIGVAQVPIATTDTSQESVVLLEANLDDMNPQVFGYVLDRLLLEGALDVYAVPVQMKKNRPGFVLTVMCRAEEASKLTEIIFAETTTLGIRRREEKREILPRKWIAVSTPWGDVRLKVGSMHGSVTNYAPEYEDCRRLAAEHHVPLKAVMQEAVQGYLRSLGSEGDDR